MTLPLDFYEKVIELQQEYFGKDTHRVGNTIQTNGTFMDRKFANFCRDNRINIGISFEGPYDDVMRQDGDKVDKNISYLSKKDHVFSVNSTICSETVGRQSEIYRYFRDRGVDVSMSPVVPCGCAADDTSLIPDADEYIAESIKVFDEWLTDVDSDVPLIPHYLYVLNALGDPVDSDCAHNSCLMKWLCIYPNGDLYPCAKGCPEDFRMCNIADVSSISEVFMTKGFRCLLEGTIVRREKCRAECNLFDHCNGGCSMDACFECGLENNGGDSCRIFKSVFGHVQDVMDDILETRPDLSKYNKFVRDAVVGKLVKPEVTGL